MEDNKMLNELYRQKYLKYKAKYLELRDQSGGIKLWPFGKKKDKKKDKKEDDEIRFKNCAILKLSIRTNNEKHSVTLDLVYSGEVKDIKRKYYITKNDFSKFITPEEKQEQNQTRRVEIKEKINAMIISDTPASQNYIICTHNTRIRCFIHQFFPNKNDVNIDVKIGNNIGNEIVFGRRTCPENKIQELLGNDNMNQKYNKDIYIVRHGEAVHNTASSFTKKPGQLLGEYDKLLTNDGKEQANKANVEFKNIMNNKSINYIFSSKLRRTRQTLNILLENINGIERKIIIVLPCSHELRVFDEKKGDNCDNYNKGLYVPNENRSKCVYDDQKIKSFKSKDKKIHNKECEQEDTYNINWNFFNDFYNQPGNTRRQCRDTNMIQLLLEFVRNAETYMIKMP